MWMRQEHALYTLVAFGDLGGSGGYGMVLESLQYTGTRTLRKVFAASKAVTESSGVYSRFRKYTDALVGKYTIVQLESLVMDNRNKDWVRAYPLAPFAGKARKKEVDARLRFLKAFWLSSDTLSGRHTAEKEAVQVALDNLTGNSGLGNLDTRWFKKKVW